MTGSRCACATAAVLIPGPPARSWPGWRALTGAHRTDLWDAVPA